MWYICVLCVQPQNRFMFLYPMHIAELCIIFCLAFHVMACGGEGRPVLRLGPATILALLLMFFGYISMHTGALMVGAARSWNSNMDIIWKNSVVLILVEALAFNVARVWGVQVTLLLATLWWVKGGLRLSASGSTYGGDRIMGAAVSLIENPNGFAYLMAVMLPMYLFFFQQAKNRWLRYFFIGLVLSGVYIIFQTGSRTGFISLLALSIFLVPKYLMKRKVTLIFGAVSVYYILSIVSPGNIERFRTIPASVADFIFGARKDTGQEKAVSEMTQDEQSAWERRQKNRDTWALVKRYPFFGVGIDADDREIPSDLPYARGQVHNEFLYAGKQMGIVGMGIYVGLIATLVLCAWRVERLCKGWWPACADLGWTLRLQGIVFISGGFFSPISWNPLFLILAGSASALLTNLRQKAYEYAPATVPTNERRNA